MLSVSGDNLIFKGPTFPQQKFLLRESSFPLSKLLSTPGLTGKRKFLLSYFLAKAFWQFYDSDWMQREWTKEAVHFMFERRGKTVKGIFVNEPFISARFYDYHQLCDPKDEYKAHQFPKILALGIMLLEIELGVKIEDYRMPEALNYEHGPTVYDDYAAAVELFGETELWERRETIKAFKEMIGICLIPDPFMPFVNDVQGLRDAFKKLVVNSLQVLYKEAWENPEEASVFPIELDPPGPSAPNTERNTPYHETALTTPLFTSLPATPAPQRQYNLPLHHPAVAQHPRSSYHSMQ